MLVSGTANLKLGRIGKLDGIDKVIEFAVELALVLFVKLKKHECIKDTQLRALRIDADNIRGREAEIGYDPLDRRRAR